MTARDLVPSLFFPLALLILLAPASAAAEGPAALTPEEEIGRRIYLEGRSSDDPEEEITAILGGAGGTEIPGWTLPCGSCHGADGAGGAEGGVRPSNVTWPALTKPYGIRHESGREHPPYDESTLVRAITMGLDPAGNHLHVAMPRYRLTHAQADALVAYLKRLGTTRRPGIDDDRVRLGVVLPPAAHGARMGAAIRVVITAWAAEQDGGIYGRRLEPRFLSPPAEPAARRRAVAAWLEEEDVFALIAPFMVGAERELASLAAERELPVIGPFSLEPQLDFPLNRFVFYLLSGYPEQGRALAELAAGRLIATPRRVIVLHPELPSRARVAAAIRDQAAKVADGAWDDVAMVVYPPGALAAAATVARERAAGCDALFFLGDPDETRALLEAAAAVGWRPHVFLLGALAGDAARAAGELAERLYVAYPSLPRDLAPDGLRRFHALLGEDVEPALAPVQLAAFGAAELLREGLERVGRDLSREGLVTALEQLYRHRIGVAPELTFGPNRRIGALGAWVVAFDAATGRPASSSWVTPR